MLTINNKRTKREYEAAAMEILSLEAGSPLLAGSIIHSNSIIMPVEQEKGTDITLSSPEFNQIWE